ncbi:hypothetical protein [Zobellia roscoffensis]|uniref:hypothetical protein n=1 Tax=Zobellia roscoffensis TaxID=2779508 RepID=UPI00188D09B9|nr:hypothetical protein [Zobellia roscoffensis]
MCMYIGYLLSFGDDIKTLSTKPRFFRIKYTIIGMITVSIKMGSTLALWMAMVLYLGVIKK